MENGKGKLSATKKQLQRPKQMGFHVGSGLVKSEADRKKEFKEAFKEARKVMGSGGTFTFQIGEEEPKHILLNIKKKFRLHLDISKSLGHCKKQVTTKTLQLLS